jgi:hypothetical protein
MTVFTPHNLLIFIILALLIFGILMVIAGMFLLIFRASGNEIKALTSQTHKLIQKGIAEEVAGLVGQASTLLNSVNDLIKNTAGVGVSLIISGLVFICISAYIAFQLYR